MALQKTHTLNDGVELKYWVVSGFQFIDYHSRTAQLWVLGFVDQVKRNAGASYIPQATRTLHIKQADFDNYFRDADLSPAGATLLSQAYEYLKNEVSFFSDAVDV